MIIDPPIRPPEDLVEQIREAKLALRIAVALDDLDETFDAERRLEWLRQQHAWESGWLVESAS